MNTAPKESKSVFSSEAKGVMIGCLVWIVLLFALGRSCSNKIKESKARLAAWDSKVMEAKPILPPSESDIVEAIKAEYKTDSKIVVSFDEGAKWDTNALGHPGSEIEWTYIGVSVDGNQYTYGQEAIVSTRGQRYNGFYDNNIAIVVDKDLSYSVEKIVGGNNISYSYPVYKCRLKNGGSVDELELVPFFMVPTR